MKIESTKNLFNEIEGTNTFEVKTLGKRKDLEGLMEKLKMYGYEFDKEGNFVSYSERATELLELANELIGNNKLDQREFMEVFSENARNYFSLYDDFKNKNFEFTYKLDMNNIEIVTEEDKNGGKTSKVIITIKENEETGQPLSYKEVNKSN